MGKDSHNKGLEESIFLRLKLIDVFFQQAQKLENSILAICNKNWKQIIGDIDDTRTSCILPSDFKTSYSFIDLIFISSILNLNP